MSEEENKKSRTEYHREYAKKRRATEEGKEEAIQFSLKWQKENPEEYKLYQREYKREYMRQRRAKTKQEQEAEAEEKRDIEVEKAKHN